MKTTHNKTRLKELMITDPYFKMILEGIIETEEKNKFTQEVTGEV